MRCKSIPSFQVSRAYFFKFVELFGSFQVVLVNIHDKFIVFSMLMLKRDVEVRIVPVERCCAIYNYVMVEKGPNSISFMFIHISFFFDVLSWMFSKYKTLLSYNFTRTRYLVTSISPFEKNP